ncbi:hypothetical protein [Janthinobacterium agaricidamnosum]|uniref:Transmembrane protein n=1 Tax=Janthinobacterium agaricidamnosum NBRC 102515 = DSM 9628 TaxID=1349767 RepID=W0UZU8_9BURK|nr:hypothetical protein [Janthinobacterium agaricidamnosum]CDG82099.1 hypothetical protein GJA_1448 [Janthinobacterium agaricidamnosum NBRC 102515 = DSM 9628]
MMTLDLAAAALVLLRGLFFAINHMCPQTSLAIRIAWVWLTLGAAALLLLGRTPTWPELLLHCGIAVLVWCDRREPFLKGTPCN